MKRIFNFVALALVLTSFELKATTPTLTTISQPLYFLASAGDAEIQIVKTPKILNNSAAMFWVGLFSSPTEVPGSGGDLNLISIYGLSIKAVSQDKDGKVTEIGIDTSNARRPERYPFTIEEVTRATVKAIRTEFPDEAKTKIIMLKVDGALTVNKEGEQAGAPSPLPAK